MPGCLLRFSNYLNLEKRRFIVVSLRFTVMRTLIVSSKGSPEAIRDF